MYAKSTRLSAKRDDQIARPRQSGQIFLIASYQILKNYAILINYKSLFQEKDSLQFNHFQFSKMNKLL